MSSKELRLVKLDRPRLIMAGWIGEEIHHTACGSDEHGGFAAPASARITPAKPMLVDKQTYTNGIGACVIGHRVWLPAGVARLHPRRCGHRRRRHDSAAANRAGREGEVPGFTALPACHAGGEGRGESTELQRRGRRRGGKLFHRAEWPEVTLGHVADAFQSDEHRLRRAGSVVVARRELSRQKAAAAKRATALWCSEDTDHDGKADKPVSSQEPALASPLGVAVIDGKVVVSQPPTCSCIPMPMAISKPRSARWLTGFNGRQHDHSLHSVTAGPTGSGISIKATPVPVHGPQRQDLPHGQPVSTANIAGMKSDDGHVWIGGFSVRMNPDGTHVNIIRHNYRNSYEQTLTSYGDLFKSDNDDPPACRDAGLEGGNAGSASADGQRSWEVRTNAPPGHADGRVASGRPGFDARRVMSGGDPPPARPL